MNPKCLSKKTVAILALLFAVIVVNVRAQSTETLQLLDTFLKYSKINSQSCETCFLTEGQDSLGRVIVQDIQQMAAANPRCGASVEISDAGYVYVVIPSNLNREVPSLGISCHLDLTPEVPTGEINPIVSEIDGRTIIHTDGTSLLGADDKCGCAIAVELIRTLLSDNGLPHGEVIFAFCPNEDVGRAAESIDPEKFNPDILFDLDGVGGEAVTHSNFTARGFDVHFYGRDAHPSEAKVLKLGDAVAAAATFIASVPLEHRPENTEGKQGYIHPWSFKQNGQEVTVTTRVRYFDPEEGAKFSHIIEEALDKIETDFPNVQVNVVNDKIQYENVAITLHPLAHRLVEQAAAKTGKEITFVDERAGTTAAMFAAKGLKGGMCVFTGQHEPHTTREFADLKEMQDAYALMLNIIELLPEITKN